MPRRITALIASVAVLTLGGCGGSAELVSDGAAGSLAEDEFIAVVSEAERDAKSVSMDMRIGGPDRTEQMRMSGHVRHGAGPADIAMDLTVSGSVFPSPLSVIVVDEVMYLEMGALTDGKYVTYDLNDPNTSMGDLLGGVQLDPTAQVRGFRGAIEGFDVAGTQRLDSVDTTRYRVTVDTTTLLANLETTPEAVFGSGVEPPDQVTYEFWVGPDRLPRRISFTLAGVTTRLDMSKWGERVDIGAPTPDRITDRDPFADLPVSPLV